MKDASGTELGETLLRVRQASLIAAVQFVPKPYNGHATVFVATRRMIEPYRDKYLGWEPVVRGGIEAVPIEGDHDSIFEDPGVRPMGEKANAILLGAEPPRRSAAGL